jgi:hypothetical protein
MIGKNQTHIISVYDFTGEALKPWRDMGFDCFAYDIQHNGEETRDGITYCRADLHSVEDLYAIASRHYDKARFLSAFPVCTDLAVSGAKHFARKERENPGFQERAAQHAERCAVVADMLQVPYYIENPVSRLATLWRKPDHTFQPFEYGGYIPAAEAEHPRWPEYIAPSDAYSKRTCLWTGNGFNMPEPKPVDCESFGKSTQWGKLGGKSVKTKNIRSATPRGFAKAVALANCQAN